MAYLRRFPIDAPKIDRSFAARLPDQTQDYAIVAAISGLARALVLEVVADGVEHIDQRDALHQLGLHPMPGWVYLQAIDQAAMQVLLATTPVAGYALKRPCRRANSPPRAQALIRRIRKTLATLKGRDE